MVGRVRCAVPACSALSAPPWMQAVLRPNRLRAGLHAAVTCCASSLHHEATSVMYHILHRRLQKVQSGNLTPRGAFMSNRELAWWARE